jgi:uncharacterized Ntn-hydrolase superfamily protein
MTYSIVARDPRTGALGIAVQTCYFAAGSVVPWARPDVGAVATQAFAEPAYGPRTLDAIERGADAGTALQAARSADPAHVMRQVGVVDRNGNADAFTGDLCIDHAGHYVGDAYTVQANMMASPEVWPAMAEVFEHSDGALPERLLKALDAAERAGGDARGRMSAAMLVVDEKGTLVDVRVDHHERPLDELARLVRVSAAFRSYERATDALFAGRAEEALQQVEIALATLPDDENMRFLHAGALVFSGRVDEAQSVTRELVAKRASWATVIRSFAAKGLLPLPEGVDVEAFLK